jgi:hypothetical protein
MRTNLFIKTMLVVIALLLVVDIWMSRREAPMLPPPRPYRIFYVPPDPNSASLVANRLAGESRTLVGFARDGAGGFIGILQ